MENAKQKAIEKAYGEYWEKVKDLVDENGWVDSEKGYLLYNDKWFDNLFEQTPPIRNGFNRVRFNVRQKSLTGIETNNNWISINSEEDLPKDSDDVEFFVIINGVSTTRVFFNGKFVNDYQLNIGDYDDLPTQPTHYQPIILPKPPIY